MNVSNGRILFTLASFLLLLVANSSFAQCENPVSLTEVTNGINTGFSANPSLPQSAFVRSAQGENVRGFISGEAFGPNTEISQCDSDYILYYLWLGAFGDTAAERIAAVQDFRSNTTIFPNSIPITIDGVSFPSFETSPADGFWPNNDRRPMAYIIIGYIIQPRQLSQGLHTAQILPDIIGINNLINITSSPAVCATPVECARQAEHAPYKLGLDGWDKANKKWVTPADVKGTAYSSYGGTGPGIDCSGLVEWSRNLANKQGYTDKGSWQLCSDTDSVAVTDSARQPGDIMCFDYDADGGIDHMAMFVGSGPSGPEFIEAVYGFGLNRVAALPVQDIDTSPTRSAAFRRTSCSDCGYRRLKSEATPPAISFQTQSPITLSVTDPDGNVIDRDTIYESRSERAIAIRDVLYYTFVDGEHDTVYSPLLKQGAYYISVSPKGSADPNSTYSLATLIDGVEAAVLAADVRVADIPDNGYGVTIEGSILTTFTPLTLRVLQEKINVSSHGIIPVAVLSTQTVDATELDVTSLAFGLGGAIEAHGMLHMEDVDGDGFLDGVLHFRTQDTNLNAQDSIVSLKGQLVDGTKVRGNDEIETE